MGGPYAHVPGESIDTRHDEAIGDAWFTFHNTRINPALAIHTSTGHVKPPSRLCGA